MVYQIQSKLGTPRWLVLHQRLEFDKIQILSNLCRCFKLFSTTSSVTSSDLKNFFLVLLENKICLFIEFLSILSIISFLYKKCPYFPCLCFFPFLVLVQFKQSVQHEKWNIHFYIEYCKQTIVICTTLASRLSLSVSRDTHDLCEQQS